MRVLALGMLVCGAPSFCAVALAQVAVPVRGVFDHDGINTTYYQLVIDGVPQQQVTIEPAIPVGPQGQQLQVRFTLTPGTHTVTLAACNQTCSASVSDSANVPNPPPGAPTQWKILLSGTVTITPQ